MVVRPSFPEMGTTTSWGLGETMELRRIDQQQVQLDLTESELNVLRNGLSEALEALEDWEFATRMGVERDEARQVREALRVAVRRMEEPRSDS